MSTHVQRTIASLALLAAALTVAACAVLLRPEPAAASVIGQRRFIFGPMTTGPGEGIRVNVFNSGPLRSPAFTYQILPGLGGALEAAGVIGQVEPGSGASLGVPPPPGSHIVVLTFGFPAKNESIPWPFTGTVEVIGGNAGGDLIPGRTVVAGAVKVGREIVDHVRRCRDVRRRRIVR